METIGIVPYGNHYWEIQATTPQGDTRSIIIKGASREEVQEMAAARELADALAALAKVAVWDDEQVSKEVFWPAFEKARTALRKAGRS